MNYIILFIKGLIIGFAKTLPGVSGGLVSIILNVYEKGLYFLSHFFNDIKLSLKFLVPIGSGILISMILSSNLILFLLKYYYLPTILFFVGLMLGNIKLKKKGILISTFSFIFVLILFFINKENSVSISGIKGSITLFIVGFIESGTMVIPGISGTAVLMLLGYYNIIISSISKLISINSFILELPILLPFTLGLIIGTLIFVKVMDYLFNNYRSVVNSLILGLSLSSILSLILGTLKYNYTFSEIIFSFILLIIGYIISFIFEYKNNKDI